MRNSYRSFTNRIAALEALEAAQQAQEARFPPADTLEDIEIAWVLCDALSRGCMHSWHDWQRGPVWVNVLFLLIDRGYSDWLWALQPRMQALVDTYRSEIVALIPGDCRSTTQIDAAIIAALGARYASPDEILEEA